MKRFLPPSGMLVSVCILAVLFWTACGGGGTGPSTTNSVPVASLSGSTVSFAGQAMGSATPAAAVTLTNSGGAALSISGISMSGTNSSEFSETNNCGSSLSAGASCTLSVTFTPSATGSRTATVSVADNASGSPQTVQLTGQGLAASQATFGTLGAAVGAATSCSSVNATGGTTNATCYVVNVSNCPNGIADQNVWVKVNNPGAAKGTITFLTGGGGAPNYYDTNFAFGPDVVDTVSNAGFTTAQINFAPAPKGFTGGTPAGWLTGPGGIRDLSCRFSTVSKWVYDNLRASGAPFCHTGNSGGSAAPAYSLAYHGFDAYYKYVELTSGPPFARIDKGCICQPQHTHLTQCGQGVLDECYLDADGASFVDPAYLPPTTSLTSACTSSMAGDTTYQQQFYNDSIASPNASYNFPNVVIHFVYGGLDTGSAEPQGQEWIDGGSVSPDGTFTSPPITGKGGVTQACVPTAPHAIADDSAGAMTIANDLIANCH